MFQIVTIVNFNVDQGNDFISIVGSSGARVRGVRFSVFLLWITFSSKFKNSNNVVKDPNYLTKDIIIRQQWTMMRYGK